MVYFVFKRKIKLYIIDELNKASLIENTSKVSTNNHRAWRDFLEMKKEVDNENEMFSSTDNAIQRQPDKLYKPRELRKSESLDGTHSPSLIDIIKVNADLRNSLNNNLKIKSNKDLRNIRNSKSNHKTSNNKRGHKKKKGKLNEKLCWKYLGSKENIKKYMKKKRRKMIKEEIREKIFNFKRQTKICHNLRALHKFTRLQTRRNGAFKERSASTQHRLSTCRRINNSNIPGVIQAASKPL